MISIDLWGGLGNQLFQIASTYGHALRHNLNCGFDITQTYLPLQGRKAIEYAKNLYFSLPKIKHGDYNLEVWKAKRWEYDPIPPKDNVLLNGYFQSPKPFDEYREKILELFLNDDTRWGILNRLADRYSVELRDSVSVHMRRGDYAKFPDIHPIIEEKYYMEAVSTLRKEKNINCILVFSDDIAWCKQNFRSPEVRYMDGLHDYEAILLMSLCDHNVIANSSFSWWGAYFNEKKDKIVYAPKRWCGPNAGHGWDDIYLPNMRVI